VKKTLGAIWKLNWFILWVMMTIGFVGHIFFLKSTDSVSSGLSDYEQMEAREWIIETQQLQYDYYLGLEVEQLAEDRR